MNLSSFSVMCFSFGVLLIALLVIAKSRDLPAKIFLLFSFAVCIWGFSASLWMTQAYSEITTLFLSRLCHVGAIFVPALWIHFLFEFLRKKEPFRHFYFVSYLTSTFFAFNAFFDHFVSGLHSIGKFNYYTSPGPMYHFFVIFFMAYISFSFVYLFQTLTHSTGIERVRIRYLFFATICGYIGGGLTFLPVYKINVPLEPLFVMLFYPWLMGIALIRYGLFDNEQIADAFQREKLAAIGIIATSLNHELRNPLYIAKGRIESHLDAIERGLYSKDQIRSQVGDDVLKISLTQLNRAMEIIQRFSDFAKPMGAVNIKERVNVSQTVEDVLNMVSNELKMQKIELVKNIADDIFLSVNRRQFEEIIFNLIVNACHAMSETGGNLMIKVWLKKENIILEISDTGPGITKENLSRIFDPFFTTKTNKGTGLGLYIVKQLVAKNNGKISVSSELGHGTAFTLEFPL